MAFFLQNDFSESNSIYETEYKKKDESLIINCDGFCINPQKEKAKGYAMQHEGYPKYFWNELLIHFPKGVL